LNRTLAAEFVHSLQLPGLPPPDPSRLASFKTDDWERSFEWLQLSGLALLFWDRLKRSGAENILPRHVGARLARNAANNQVRVGEMWREFVSINERLESAGVSYASLKGFPLVPDYFPDPSLRSFTDYDYLLSYDSIERAGQALESAGYVCRDRNDSYAVTYSPRSHPPRLIADLDEMYSAGLPREVELHWTLWSEEKVGIRLKLPGDIMARARWQEWQGVSFRALGEADALIYHAMHTFRHLLEGWCRLCAVYEIAHVLSRRARDADFWKGFRTRIGGCPRLSQVAGVIFALASRVFQVQVPAEVASSTVQTLTPAMALWVERYGTDSALQNFSADKFSLLLYREFVDDPRAWRAVRRRRVFLLKWPSRVGEVSGANSSRLSAAGQRFAYLLRLLRFHLPASVRYAWELGKWHRRLTRVCGAPSRAWVSRRVAR